MTFVNLCQSQTVHQENVEIALSDFSMSVQCIFFHLSKVHTIKKSQSQNLKTLDFFYDKYYCASLYARIVIIWAAYDIERLFNLVFLPI